MKKLIVLLLFCIFLLGCGTQTQKVSFKYYAASSGGNVNDYSATLTFQGDKLVEGSQKMIENTETFECEFKGEKWMDLEGNECSYMWDVLPKTNKEFNEMIVAKTVKDCDGPLERFDICYKLLN